MLIYGYVKSYRHLGITEMCFGAHLLGVSVDLYLMQHVTCLVTRLVLPKSLQEMDEKRSGVGMDERCLMDEYQEDDDCWAGAVTVGRTPGHGHARLWRAPGAPPSVPLRLARPRDALICVELPESFLHHAQAARMAPLSTIVDTVPFPDSVHILLALQLPKPSFLWQQTPRNRSSRQAYSSSNSIHLVGFEKTFYFRLLFIADYGYGPLPFGFSGLGVGFGLMCSDVTQGTQLFDRNCDGIEEMR